MKIFKIFIITVLTILLTGFLYVQYKLNQAVPEKNGKIDLEFIKEKVEVYTDQMGIPHIYAQNEEDAYRTLGFIIASERLFQMDLMRRIASGRLSEILGKDFVKTDHLLRKLRIRKSMEDFYELNKNKIDPQIIKSAEAFFDGVHQFMQSSPLPIEFIILGYEPEKFSLIDAMGVSGYMALSFAEALVGDVLFSELAKDIPQDMVNQLRVGPKAYFDKNGISKNSSFINKRDFLRNILKTHDLLNEVFFMFQGSNSWVISGKRTKSGKPILANDPHIAYSNPSVWFEAHIHTPEWELYGHYLPLVPFAVLGHNKQKAWAVTMSEADDFDFFIEKIHPEDKNKVQYKNNWVDLKNEEYTIKVKGAEDIKSSVRISPHGPILDDLEESPKDKSIALTWSYFHPENDVMSAFYFLGKAKNLNEYKAAIKRAAAPGLNISWIDDSGDIAWWMMGKIPKRVKGLQSDILLEGWHGKHDYLGYYSFEENPHSVNPENGIIISTNFKPLDKKYDEIDGYWQPAPRMERLLEIFKDKSKLWGLEELKEVQIDVWAQTEKDKRNILLQSVIAKSDFEKNILRELKNWNIYSDINSIGSTIYHVWSTFVMRNALIDEMGADRFKAFSKLADYLHFYSVLMNDPNSGWWDNIQRTDKVKESREMIIEESFQNMITFLTDKLGNDIKEWKWGKLHTVEYVHPIGKVKPFNLIFNIGPFPAPGSYSQVNNISFKRGSLNYESHLGPSTRRLIDLGNPLISYGILPTGNSGHVKSKHYDDQAKLYLEGNYRKQLLDLKEISSTAIGILEIE